MKSLWLAILLTVFFVFSPVPLQAQEKQGRIGGFEDANAGKSSSDDEEEDEENNYEEEESGGLFFDILEILFYILFDADDEEQEVFYDDDTGEALPLNSLDSPGPAQAYASGENPDSTRNPVAAETTQPLSFGLYPFDGNGLIHEDGSGKNYLGRLAAGMHYIDRDLSALRLNGTFTFSEGHGLRLDFYNYKERLERGSDNLQILNVAYSYLFLASDKTLLSLSAGASLLYPDGAKAALWGPTLALDGRFFIIQPVSLSGRLGVNSYLGGGVQGANLMMEAALFAGLHYLRGELYGGVRTLMPLKDTSAAFLGPEIGLRFWF